MQDYLKLQNGSDIRGIALPGVAGENVNLTPEVAGRIAVGFLKWLCGKTGKSPDKITISIGRDPRLSGEAITNAFAEGTAACGVQLLDCGIASTPAMFMSTVFKEFEADGAVMITASHLPWNRNGLKFFSKDGGLDKKDITAILETAASDFEFPIGGAKPVEHPALMDRYAKHLRTIITEAVAKASPAEVAEAVGVWKPLAGLKIAVDAGNGSGGFYANKVLAPLGADVSASRYLDPDGNFPNHIPNPENDEAMKAITEATLEGGCDLGLIFDTDVDRSSAVDEKGREINKNGIVALAAALIADEYPGSTVVTDSITSNELTDYLENKLGMKHLRFKRGYRNVINKAIELNAAGIDSELAIETSGHAAYKQNYFLDDGAYLATLIVIRTALLKKAGLGISSVIADLKEPAEAIEIRMPITAADFKAVGDVALEKVRAAVASGAAAADGLKLEIVEPNYEGIRVAVSGDVNGWFLLRKSLHDPIMPLNIEAQEAGGVDVIRGIIRKCFVGVGGVDTAKL